MSEETPEETGKTARSRGPSMGVIVAIAIAVGAGFGAAGVYATGKLNGNGETALAAGGGQCDAAIAKGEALEPLLTGEIAAMAGRTEPNAVGGLSFNDGDGNAMSLADTGGKVRLVNLWATWCAPCREEMPALDALQAEKGGEEFEVVAISVDGGSDEKPRKFFNEMDLGNLSFYHDPTIGAFNTLKKEGLAFGLPVTLLVDEDDCVIANMNGPAEWASPDAVRMIEAATTSESAG